VAPPVFDPGTNSLEQFKKMAQKVEDKEFNQTTNENYTREDDLEELKAKWAAERLAKPE
jgi:hypothetical protein